MSKVLSLLSKNKINSEELEYLLSQRVEGNAKFLLVDIREPYEYESEHIVGVDMLLPTTRFGEWAPMLAEHYKDEKLIITCRTANRTGQVQAIMVQEFGADNIIDHLGGIVSYQGATESGRGVLDE